MDNHDHIVAAATATLGVIRRHETEVATRDFHFLADEPLDGAEGVGPTPTEYLLIALASCTTITLRQYADRKYAMPATLVSTCVTTTSAPKAPNLTSSAPSRCPKRSPSPTWTS